MSNARPALSNRCPRQPISCPRHPRRPVYLWRCVPVTGRDHRRQPAHRDLHPAATPGPLPLRPSPARADVELPDNEIAGCRRRRVGHYPALSDRCPPGPSPCPAPSIGQTRCPLRCPGLVQRPVVDTPRRPVSPVQPAPTPDPRSVERPGYGLVPPLGPAQCLDGTRRAATRTRAKDNTERAAAACRDPGHCPTGRRTPRRGLSTACLAPYRRVHCPSSTVQHRPTWSKAVQRGPMRRSKAAHQVSKGVRWTVQPRSNPCPGMSTDRQASSRPFV